MKEKQNGYHEYECMNEEAKCTYHETTNMFFC